MERKISLIVLVFQGEEHLERLVSHIRTTSLGVDYEILIANAASTGHLREIESRSNVRWLDAPDNEHAELVNYAATKARGDIFVFLSPENIAPLGFLQSIIKAVEEGADAGCFRIKFDTDNWFSKANAWFYPIRY